MTIKMFGLKFYYKNTSFTSTWALSNIFPTESLVLRTWIKYENHFINTNWTRENISFYPHFISVTQWRIHFPPFHKQREWAIFFSNNTQLFSDRHGTLANTEFSSFFRSRARFLKLLKEYVFQWMTSNCNFKSIKNNWNFVRFKNNFFFVLL